MLIRTAFVAAQPGFLRSNQSQSLRQQPASTCAVYEILNGQACIGNDLWNAPAVDTAACCTLCGGEPNCQAFSWNQSSQTDQKSGQCYLKTSCATKENNPNIIAGVAAKLSPYPAPPTADVQFDMISSIPGLTGGAPNSAVLVYPTNAIESDELLPVVSFAHGTGTGSGNNLELGYHTDLASIAARGFIVIAPKSCPVIECGAGYSHDQLAVLAAVKSEGAKLHPVLSKADTSRTAVVGHSMGAMASVLSASATYTGQYSIKAAVAQHSCIDTTKGQPASAATINVPILFTTGGLDTICPSIYTTYLYDYVNPSLRFSLSWNTATHDEPVDGVGMLRDVAPTADFLSCAVKGEGCLSPVQFCQFAAADQCHHGYT